MDPKARDRRLRGLGPDPVGGVPPVSVTGARPTPALAAELGPTGTPTTAAVLAAFAYWIPEHEAETEEEATEPVTVLVMGRRNIDVSDQPPDARGGAGLDRPRLNAAARQYGLEVEYRTIHAAKGSEADYAVLIDTGVPSSATEPAQLALDRAIAAETGGGPRSSSRAVVHLLSGTVGGPRVFPRTHHGSSASRSGPDIAKFRVEFCGPVAGAGSWGPRKNNSLKAAVLAH